MAMFKSARSRCAPAILGTRRHGNGAAGSIRAAILAGAGLESLRPSPSRAAFEAAWRDYLPNCTDADFTEYRRQRDWTAWKYAMWDAARRKEDQAAA